MDLNDQVQVSLYSRVLSSCSVVQPVSDFVDNPVEPDEEVVSGNRTARLDLALM